MGNLNYGEVFWTKLPQCQLSSLPSNFTHSCRISFIKQFHENISVNYSNYLVKSKNLLSIDTTKSNTVVTGEVDFEFDKNERVTYINLTQMWL